MMPMSEPENDKDLNSERLSFDELNKTLLPPNNLEHSIIEKLKTENLIHEKMSTTKIYWMAAAIVIIVLSFFAGRMTTTMDRFDPPKQSFLLLLREDSTFSGTDINAIISEYSAWARNLREKGELSSAEKLTKDSYSFGTLPPIHGPGITGFFIIHAVDLKAAEKIAKSHPHLKYHGGVELMPIEKL